MALQDPDTNPPPVRPPLQIRVSDAKVTQSVKDFETFISFIFSISIFGASAFAVVVGGMTDPADLWPADSPPTFSMRTARTFIAVAWLCFILSLAVAAYASSALTMMRQRAGGVEDREWGRRWDAIGLVASAVLYLLLVAAFLFLSLAMVAYVGAVGLADDLTHTSGKRSG
ncbi:hypothetical protein B0T22DRAFT_536454 [Podospora appendiculata]|uniref:Uncharacterized protein n=1 Tax=Podospora appendiculata TaxID=314037 RepID=A0AAE0XC84_9PEZI|nr:hypothetical protein B0T22DRAFT_536454 [Podospora appendiculata]